MDTEKNYTLYEIIENSFDFSSYDEESKKMLITETTDMIMESTILRLLSESSEEIQQKFGAMVETEPDEQKMLTFITENFPNFNDILIDEIKVFKSLGEEKKAA